MSIFTQDSNNPENSTKSLLSEVDELVIVDKDDPLNDPDLDN